MNLPKLFKKSLIVCSLSFMSLNATFAEDINLKEIVDSCNAGDIDNCFLAGTLLIEGTDVEKDSLTGVKLAEKACTKGLREACSYLGEEYLTGKHLKANSNQAAYYIELACNAALDFLD